MQAAVSVWCECFWDIAIDKIKSNDAKYPPEKVLNLDNANNPEITLEPEIVNRIKAKVNTAKAGGGFK